MKFPNVRYQNFGPFVDISLKLDNRGLVLVQGQNEVSTSADSNGSGKSFLLEGIVWCLFGQTMRGIKGDEVINRQSKKNCIVSVDVDIDGTKLTIIRYRKAKKGGIKLPDEGAGPTGSGLLVFVDGVDMTKGTIKETEALIGETIGLDYSTFTRSIYFDGANITPFPTLTDREIKAVFEKALGLEDFQKAAGVIKARHSGLMSRMSAVDSKIMMEQSRVSTAEVEVLNAAERVKGFEADRERKITDIQTKIDAIEVEDVEDLTKQRSLLAEQITAETAKLKQFDDTLPGMQRKNADKRTQAAGVKAEANVNYRNATNSEKAAEEAVSSAGSKIGTPCGECGKPYEEHDLSSHIDIMRAKAVEFKEQAAVFYVALQNAIQVEHDLATEAAKIEKLAQMREEAARGLSGLQVAQKGIDSRLENADALRASEDALKASQNDIRSEVNPYVSDTDRWNLAKTDAQRNVDTHMAEKQAIQGELDDLAILEKAYGRSGLKAHVLETVTPVLNARANDYAARLADGTVDIEFSTMTTNKDGSIAERFNVAVTNRQGAESYLGNSSGEKRKIDLAISLALSDMVAARASKPVDLWVADEIAESLDQTALERVVDLLRDRARERGTLMVISHTDMSSYIPKTITVTKKPTGTTIDGGGWLAEGW